jgi:ankyrin repeat protein
LSPSEPFYTFGILTTAPPAISYCACRKVGMKGLLPIVVLSALLIPAGQSFGRIDTYGTILALLQVASQNGDLPKARGLLLTLTRRYHHYSFFTDGGDLIRLGIDPNVRGDMSNTPLMTVLDNPTYVQHLLGLGANVNAKNQAGKTAIDSATNPQTIQLLKQAGAKSGRSE